MVPEYKIDHHSRSPNVGTQSTIRKYVPERQIAYVKPSVRAVRFPLRKSLERFWLPA